jgi:hypothetical protein
MNMKIYSPEGEVTDEVVELCSTTPLFSGGKIGVLENGKPNANLLLTKIAEGLADRVDAEFSITTGKGERANAATACNPQVIGMLAEEVQLVLTGSAD